MKTRKNTLENSEKYQRDLKKNLEKCSRQTQTILGKIPQKTWKNALQKNGSRRQNHFFQLWMYHVYHFPFSSSSIILRGFPRGTFRVPTGFPRGTTNGQWYYPPGTGSCKIVGVFNLRCRSFDYSSDKGIEEVLEMIYQEMTERKSKLGFLKGLTDMKRRFRRFNDGKTRAKYTGTRIGKRSESLGWTIFSRL